MHPQPTPIAAALLIRFSTSDADTASQLDHAFRGGAVRSVQAGSLQFLRIDTTDFDRASVAGIEFWKLPAATDLATAGRLADFRDFSVPAQVNHAAQAPSAVPAIAPRESGPRVSSRLTDESSAASSDLALLDAFRRRRLRCSTPGDEIACHDFCKVQHSRILAIIRRSPLCRECAEDIAQDAWCDVLRNLPTFQLDPARGTLAAWIASIAIHAAYKEVCRRTKPREEPLASETSALLRDTGAQPAVTVGRKEGEDRLRALVEKLRPSLPDLHGQIAYRRWLDGMSYAQIAAQLGVSKQCVRGVVRRLAPKLLVLLRLAGFDPAAKK